MKNRRKTERKEKTLSAENPKPLFIYFPSLSLPQPKKRSWNFTSTPQQLAAKETRAGERAARQEGVMKKKKQRRGEKERETKNEKERKDSSSSQPPPTSKTPAPPFLLLLILGYGNF